MFSVRSVLPGTVPSTCIVPGLVRLAALIVSAPDDWIAPPALLVMARLPAPAGLIDRLPAAVMRPLLFSVLAIVSVPVPPAMICPPIFERLAAEIAALPLVLMVPPSLVSVPMAVSPSAPAPDEVMLPPALLMVAAVSVKLLPLVSILPPAELSIVPATPKPVAVEPSTAIVPPALFSAPTFVKLRAFAEI